MTESEPPQIYQGEVPWAGDGSLRCCAEYAGGMGWVLFINEFSVFLRLAEVRCVVKMFVMSGSRVAVGPCFCV